MDLYIESEDLFKVFVVSQILDPAKNFSQYKRIWLIRDDVYQWLYDSNITWWCVENYFLLFLNPITNTQYCKSACLRFDTEAGATMFKLAWQ